MVEPAAAPRRERSRRFTFVVPNAIPRSASAWEWAQHLLALGGPIGFLPWVPATFASLATAATVWWWRPGPWWIVALTAALFVAGGFAASTSERLQNIEDPRNVVVDEIAGQLLTFVFAAAAEWKIALAGFVFFRIFDILKPPPVNFAERLPGGWGIMADDVLAGLYAAAALWLLRRYTGV